MKLRSILFGAVLLAAALPARIQAQLDMDVPYAPHYTITGGAGMDRGMIFQALTSFSFSRLGMVMGPNGATTRLSAALYAITPGGAGTRGAQLAYNEQNIVDAGYTWYDIALSGSVTAGNWYELAMGSIPAGNWAFTATIEYLDFDYRTQPQFLATNGVQSMLLHDGTENGDGENNFYAPHLRIDGGGPGVVPEPASVALMATGLVGIAGTAIRRRRNS